MTDNLLEFKACQLKPFLMIVKKTINGHISVY